MKWVAMALAAALVFAGCLQSDGRKDEGSAADLPPDGQVPRELVDWDAIGCSLAVGAFIVPFDHLKTFLPDGFEPADASGLLGAPASVGEGAVLLTAYTCSEHAAINGTFVGAEINILVEDPGLDNGTVDTHYYLAQLVMPAGPELDMLVADGWNAMEGQVDVGGELPLRGDVRTDVQEYDLEVVGMTPSTLDGVSRFWHLTADGPSWFDYTVSADVQAGNVQATWDPDTLAHLLAAESTGSLGIAVPSFAWSAHYQPPK